MLVFRVAEINFQIETVKEQAMRRLMRNYLPFEVTADSPHTGDAPLFTLSLDDSISPSAEEPVKIFKYDITEDRATLYIYPDRYLLSISNTVSGETFSMDCPTVPKNDGDGKVKYRFTSDIATKKIAPPSHIVDQMLIFAFSAASLELDTLLIHASTVINDGQAVLFLGESGTGKSTHSRMWLENIEGVELLNDDAPAVRLMNGKPIVYGTPWSGKTPCYKNESRPLKAFARISRAPYNKITKISSIKALGALLPSSLPSLQQSETGLDKILTILSTLISTAGVYIMECLPDGEAASVCRSGIFGM